LPPTPSPRPESRLQASAGGAVAVSGVLTVFKLIVLEDIEPLFYAQVSEVNGPKIGGGKKRSFPGPKDRFA
jgi:hypothetical protein